MRPQDGESPLQRAEFVAVAQAMLDGKVDLLEGVRQLTDLRHSVTALDDDILIPLRGVASETDHLPIGPLREKCTPDYLQRVDKEIDEYLAKMRNEILAACLKIVRKYSRAPLRSV